MAEKRYKCKCCGYDFSEEEGKQKFFLDHKNYNEITCPMCEASYDEEENYIEAYNK